MKVAALISGGKDSILAAHMAQQHGWDLSHVVTVRSRASDSYMFHVPNTSLAPLLAQAMGAPLVAVETKGEKEAELGDIERALADLDVDGFVSGALASEYQRTRLEGIGHRLGLKSFTPLWHKDPREVLRTISGAGWDVRFAAVAAEGLGEAWLGRKFDEARLRDLDLIHEKHGVHVGGEGGEYESLVLDAPLFTQRIEVARAHREWRRDGGAWVVDEAHLAPK